MINPKISDEQCDAVFNALDEWSRSVDPCECGLPWWEGNPVKAREVIRQALAKPVKPHRDQLTTDKINSDLAIERIDELLADESFLKDVPPERVEDLKRAQSTLRAASRDLEYRINAAFYQSSGRH